MEYIIVTRHKGLVEWLNQNGIKGEVTTHIADPRIIENKVVIGALPLHLACLTEMIINVDLPNLPEELRGKDITAKQMDEAGASISKYKVTKL